MFGTRRKASQAPPVKVTTPAVDAGLARGATPDGTVERFDTTRKVVDQLDRVFAERGAEAAGIVHAALTESPIVVTIGDADAVEVHEYHVPVSNVYDPGDGLPAAEDTVFTARDALDEAAAVVVHGAQQLPLHTVDTRYVELFDNYAPGADDPDSAGQAFTRGLVTALQAVGVKLADPSHARLICQHAPASLTVYLFSGMPPGSGASGTAVAQTAVTVDGHIVNVLVTRDYSYSEWEKPGRMPSLPENRGGIAPGSTIASKIVDAAVADRTAHQQR